MSNFPKKNDLVKITNYIWEIPKNFRDDMKVPARILASEEMIDDILKDKTLWQLVNIASLPTIYGYALAMPDAHEGYGFCVGGVAAFNYENGIISPGGIGFDINCLHPKTKINLAHGTYLEIKDLKPNFRIIFFNKEKKAPQVAKILFILKKREKEIYKIKTRLGNEILITSDHPVYTLEGFKEVKNLMLGDKILNYPFLGIKYEEPLKKIILEEEKFINFCREKKLKDKEIKRVLNYLKKRKLLPIFTNSQVLLYLLKIYGYWFGNGFRIEKEKNLSILGELKDLKEIKDDLKALKIDSKIFKRILKFDQKNNKFKYKIKFSKPFTLLFLSLIYNKETPKNILPEWFNELKLWQKRIFLASLFGSKILKIEKGKRKFFLISLNFNKTSLSFAKKIKKLIQNFEIKTTKIKILNKNENILFKFYIKPEIENLIKFFEKIGFEYNFKKKILNNLFLAYLKYKNSLKNELKIKLEIKNTQKLNVCNFKNQCDENNSEIKFLPELINNSLDFYNFKNFIKEFNFKNGILIDEVIRIEKINYNGYVYDIGIDHKDHNFIANNFIVSNCGVRLLVCNLNYSDVKSRLEKLTKEIFKKVPSGVGKGGFWKLNDNEMKNILENGAQYLYKIGYAEKEDLEATESYGKLEGDATTVSKIAKARGKDQIGTIGAGNHFVEIQMVEKIYDEKLAKKLDLEKEKITVMIHCGSRGLGHQVCTDYVKEFLKELDKKGIKLVDRELAYGDFHSSLGQAYFRAMNSAANFAWANRQMITYQIRKSFEKIFGKEIKITQIYDVAHNILKIEDYDNRKLIIHRKGATRAFWPDHLELPLKYREIGQPTLIPGSMGTASYILIGQKLSKEISFGSAPHGAGRLMSRTEAKKKIKVEKIKEELNKKGIVVEAGSLSGLVEEAPLAYKDINLVVEVVDKIGIAKKLAKLIPIGVIKG